MFDLVSTTHMCATNQMATIFNQNESFTETHLQRRIIQMILVIAMRTPKTNWIVPDTHEGAECDL